MHARLAAAIAVGALASVAVAQGPLTTQVRAELRLVSQAGSPPNPVFSYDVDTHPDTLADLGVPRRFTVQYRLVDLDLTDAVAPAGLLAAQLRITSSGGTLFRALLTGNESGSLSGGGTLPPVSQSVNLVSDFSGSAANSAAGLHRPFRGGIPAPAPNNNNAANGAFESFQTVITGISPLSLTRNDQNDGGWYGLYSFTFVPNQPLGTVAAAFITDAAAGIAVAFADTGNAAGGRTLVATGDSALVIPSPAGAPPVLLLLAGLTRRRHR